MKTSVPLATDQALCTMWRSVVLDGPKVPHVVDAYRPLGLHASRIGPGLYVGAAPARARSASDARFDVLVLCAREHMPDPVAGVRRVLVCPLDDAGGPLGRADLLRAEQCAADVARHLRAGARVLATCHMGLNRSALVATLALRRLSGLPGAVCADHVRRTRPGALHPDHPFSTALAA